MICPRCSVELSISYRDNVEIDHCPKCRGVWLDRGELDKIIELAMPSSDEFFEEKYAHLDKKGAQRRGALGELFRLD